VSSSWTTPGVRYDGQEAVQVGMEMVTGADDHYITAYRCHAAQYTRDTQVSGKSSVDSLKATTLRVSLAYAHAPPFLCWVQEC
jgi:TPP-dependent pyruvate/acetoin dehydrogenase alpha subunit